MVNADAASSSLELDDEGVTDPPPADLPVGAEEDGPTRREGLGANWGTHFSSRSTTIFLYTTTAEHPPHSTGMKLYKAEKKENKRTPVITI